MPIRAPHSRRASRSATSTSAPPGASRRDFARKTAGTILYVEPLPIPLSTNSTVKPATNSGRLSRPEATSTNPAPSAIAAKVAAVTRAPPHRSASAPPTGRTSEPSSGPRKVR